MTPTEQYAKDFIRRNYFIRYKDIIKIKGSGKPDFNTPKYNFEIKRTNINGNNILYITLSNQQMERFNDNIILLIFNPIEKLPYMIIKFKDLKKRFSFNQNKNNRIYYLNNNINKLAKYRGES